MEVFCIVLKNEVLVKSLLFLAEGSLRLGAKLDFSPELFDLAWSSSVCLCKTKSQTLSLQNCTAYVLYA